MCPDDPSHMKTAEETEFRRKGREAESMAFWADRWYGKLVLLTLSVALLTLAYAPIKQFYLAWFGLAPWLIVIARCRSYKAAIFWGWLSGWMFFIANMWWMAYVTFPGMLGLMSILAAYWGLMGAIVYALWGNKPSLSPHTPDPRHVIVVAFAWTALEFIRGNFIWRGLPWLYLGHTQTPILPMCQIADVLGVYGVTFWIVLLNGILAAWVLGGYRILPILVPIEMASILTAGFAIYGLWRMHQNVAEPGPVVVVVQSNYPQSNTGEKGATEAEMINFHFKTTRSVLDKHPDVDLVVWSETVMPALNFQTRNVMRGTEYGQRLEATAKGLESLCSIYQTGLITGARYDGDWRPKGEYLQPTDMRNSAYFVERSGLMSDLRYDKIHTVPFGEFIPFKETVPWLYNIFISLGPPDMANYQLNAGDEQNLTVFPLRKTKDPLDLSTWRVVTPICFEDIDSGLTAKMFRPGEDGRKRADILVNLTNDGWFKANEMPQHLQVATFRSIENRVPTARSVNTGISGFVDSIGRSHDLVAAGTEGYAMAKLMIDPRVTFYTRFGDVFGWICVSMTGSAMLLFAMSRRKPQVA